MRKSVDRDMYLELEGIKIQFQTLPKKFIVNK